MHGVEHAHVELQFISNKGFIRTLSFLTRVPDVPGSAFDSCDGDWDVPRLCTQASHVNS